MKVCVYAIAKNEEKFVDRWVSSMMEADCICVLDTGSEDKTVEKLADWGVTVRQEIISPWRFDAARNHSLALVPADTDICVCTDLDEYFRPGWREALERAWTAGTEQMRYTYIWNFDEAGRPGTSFLYEKIHAPGVFEWEHPVHEVLRRTDGKKAWKVSACREIVLELKLLADVGLVGFPNVGKSTLVSMVSAAKPKIANYHFTTLTPVLGVVRIDSEKSFVMADIPGLIEGASEGVGLGHEFLRHVERCRLMVHIVDVSGCEGRDPIEDFDLINRELQNFSEDLAQRPMLVAANKCDIATEAQIEAFQGEIERRGYRFFPISAATRSGVDALIDAVAAALDELPPVLRYEPDPIPVEEVAPGDSRRFEITRGDDGIYYIKADWMPRILASVNMDDYESLQYLQRTLQNTGIIDRLEEMGIQENDTVDIDGFEFDYLR